MSRRLDSGREVITPRGHRERSATASGDGPFSRLGRHHVRALDTAVVYLRKHLASTILTLGVIGVVLALPAALANILHNAAGGTYALGQLSAQVNVFLKDSVSPEAGVAFARRIAGEAGVSSSRYLSAADALDEFKQHADAADALALLADNPLPASIIVTPDVHADAATLDALFVRLAAQPETDQLQVNRDWVEKLYAILDLARRLLATIMFALVITVLIVIANTVRLEIDERRAEISVTKLFGASNAYVRRPFLYSGACYGLGGALVAWLLVAGATLALQHSLQRVAALYHSTVTLPGLDFQASLLLLASGTALGWLAAFWATSRHLRRVGNPAE
ncbi:MAG: ABC transporter permease [Nevskiaceae bacterium]|nr:MAG: ABC transporter permease [Nevskiaceae bacterium]TBR73160.1 MAG: ABC transporter permease [Nevskiaceae bacterium]